MENPYLEGQLILIDKPLTWTSFDIVNKTRYLLSKQFNIKKIKVGHAGTLDPLATGLLLVCTGKMTKQIDALQGQDKEYVTTLFLGATTPSFDRETEIDATFQPNHFTLTDIQNALQPFIGSQSQVAPAYSAKRVNGQRAYIAARKGDEVVIKAHQITIHEIEILEFEYPFLKIRILCSKGTYIRSFARDFGLALNSGAYLHDLRRTKIGEYSVKNALEISEFEKNIKNLQPLM